MSNPMDNAKYNVVSNVVSPNSMASMYKKAMQNPKAFEEEFKRNNPQAYEQAKVLAKTKTPKDIVMQILQKRGINPASFM